MYRHGHMQLHIVRVKGDFGNIIGIDSVVLIRFRPRMGMRKGCFVKAEKNGYDQRDQEGRSVSVHTIDLFVFDREKARY